MFITTTTTIPKQRAVLLLPKVRPLRPTAIVARSYNMVQTQCAGFVVKFRKLLTILWQVALSWPKLNTYTDTTKPPCSYLQWNICKEMNIDTNVKWYDHEPQTVAEKDNITILWDMPIQTDREIKANRPDIVIKNKQENAACSFICPSPLKRTLQ